MKMRILGLLLALVAVFPAGCQNADDVGPEMKRALIDATGMAIDLEITGYKEKLEAAEGGTGPKENVEKFKARIAELEKELVRYRTMKPEEYPAVAGIEVDAAGEEKPSGVFDGPDTVGPIVPALKRTIPVTVKDTYHSNSLLDLDGASKSGPFYRLAGIKGGCFCILKKGKHYELTVYLVYRREYFGRIRDYYVYVADLGE